MTCHVVRIVTIFLLLVALVGVSALGQTDVAALRSLWGTRITAAEFLRRVNPEFLADLPARCREAAKTIDVQWGGEKAVMTSSLATPVSSPDSQTAGVDSVPLQDATRSTIYVDYSNRLSFSDTTARFGATNTVVWPPYFRVPFMYVRSELKHDGFVID